MKVMALNRSLGTLISEPIAVDIIPDSAIIKDNKPFFIPDFSQQWAYIATIAFRINRLGKNVATKFAQRYYDAATICLRTIPIDLITNLNNCSIKSGIATSFDGAIILGEWQPIDNFKNKPLDIIIDNNRYQIDPSSIDIDNAIKILSQYFTLKIGDIIIPGNFSEETFFDIDNHIIVKFNNNDCLSLKIK